MLNSAKFGVDLIIRSKLIPPRPGPRHVVRDRLNQYLGQLLDMPLTLMIAGAGYGKSTALADWLLETPWPVAWYSLAPDDHDPLLFLLHLIYAFETVNPNILAQLLTPFAQDGEPKIIRQTALNHLLNTLTEQLEHDTLLVLDDIHLVADKAEINQILEHLITYLPPQIHLVLTSRHPLKLPVLTRLQARGQVAYVTGENMVFQQQEVVSLFRAQYNLSLSDSQISQLLAKTEGWAIALHLMAQRFETNPGALATLDPNIETLFTFLAQDVLAQQSLAIQDFLTKTSIIQHLTPTICNYLLDLDDSAVILSNLAERDFFVIRLGDDTYRYHHLFADFLSDQLLDAAPLHQHAGHYFYNEGLHELAIHHFLCAAAYPQAIQLLIPLASELVRTGRFDILHHWLTQLPAQLLAQSPNLILALGDLYRFTSQYQLALQHYHQASQIFEQRQDFLGHSEALLGLARVYLDTVRPAKASPLLQQALDLVLNQPDLSSIPKQAQILAMLAENEANLGNAIKAKALQAESTALMGQQLTPIEVEARLLLRSGQLDKAREKLTTQAEQENHAQRAAWAPRHHRETSLLLSLLYTLQGQPEPARILAEEGVAIGQRLGSPFVEAVGYMRLGHAWQIGLDANPEQAESYYQQSLKLSEKFDVARARVEPLWGLLRLYGYQANLATAERYAQEAVQLAQRAGDGWILTWCKTTLAATYLIVGETEKGLYHMQQIWQDFSKGGDFYGQAVALLWQAMYAAPDDTLALTNLLKLAHKEGYDFLFGSPTYNTPSDPQATIPLLFLAREQNIETDYVNRLLAAHNLSNVQSHPGFTLQVQTLGAFRVWCGPQPIVPQEWRREKARHLFQLLLIHRANYLQKEQILDLLWPQVAPQNAEKHFKVALNMLQNVIEPDRQPRTPSFFIRRRGSSYGLMVNESFLTDCDRFEQHIKQGHTHEDMGEIKRAINQYQQAIDLYQGDFLEQSLYEDWTVDERERLMGVYLRTLERLARMRLQNGQAAVAIPLCQAILKRDDCWESAYRLLMVAYQRTGNRPQALRTFEQCAQVLKEALNITPMQQTIKLQQRLRYHRNISVQDA